MRYVGVDLHKTQFSVCWRNEEEDEFERYPMTPEGVGRFREKLDGGTEVAFEAAGNSSEKTTWTYPFVGVGRRICFSVVGICALTWGKVVSGPAAQLTVSKIIWKDLSNYTLANFLIQKNRSEGFSFVDI